MAKFLLGTVILSGILLIANRKSMEYKLYDKLQQRQFSTEDIPLQ